MNKGKIYLIIFIVVFFIGLFIRYFLGEDSLFWDIWSTLDVISAVSLAILAFLAYKEMIVDDEIIKIYFEYGGKEIDTKLSLLRREFTRSEIMGVLGMIYKGEGRYKITYFNNPQSLNQINKILQDKKDKFIIPLKDDEISQFNIEIN